MTSSLTSSINPDGVFYFSFTAHVLFQLAAGFRLKLLSVSAKSPQVYMIRTMGKGVQVSSQFCSVEGLRFRLEVLTVLTGNPCKALAHGIITVLLFP